MTLSEKSPYIINVIWQFDDARKETSSQYHAHACILLMNYYFIDTLETVFLLLCFLLIACNSVESPTAFYRFYMNNPACCVFIYVGVCTSIY